MLNIINSFDLNPLNFPNVESLKIVFSSFKTYLAGLPEAIKLLEYLSCKNNNFVLFLQVIIFLIMILIILIFEIIFYRK
jgi:hypothetical protein